MPHVSRPTLTCSQAEPPDSLAATDTFADVLAYFDTGWRSWWLTGFVLFVLVDPGLTLVGAYLGSFPGIQFTELNAALIGIGRQLGFAQAMFATKLVISGGLFLMWRYTPWPERSLIPFQLMIAGALATGWNLGMLTILAMSH